ncbi:MAG: pyruvate dehydrogenase-like complex component [Myxococcales bacterium]|nr:pyruvate dehydrogenase-like complex component [Myxococcales bacterium]
MAFQFYMPDIGEGVVEGEVVAWKVKVGDKVRLDQPIVEVMTDKATVELPSPRAGTISKINYKDGEICPVGKVLVEIEEDAKAVPAAGNGNGSAKPEPSRPQTATHQAMHSAVAANVPTAIPASNTGRTGAIQVVDATANRDRVLATPATRKLARQLGVEIGRVPASGKHGRVTSDDVRRFREAPSASAPAQAAKYAPIAIAKGGEEERIPLRGVRKKIAEAMARSVHTAAHFTYVEEVDMTELVTVREHAKARAAERGVKLNYLPFIVKAVVSSLKKWPQLNASLDETTQEIVRKKYYHIGIAAQGPQGLAVSVVRDADRRSIFDLSKEIDRLGEAVRNGSATREELTGSTFTISSLGKLGGVLATPIINFPEVAIIGVHKIEERPAVRGGQIVARHLMNLSVSVDHRLADGWDGAMFLQDVKTLLEDPTTMFMEMV